MNGQTSSLCTNSGEEEVVGNVEKEPVTNETSAASKNQSKEKIWHSMM